MDVRLVVEKGSSKSKVLRLKSVETLIGRRQDCDLRIPSADVSRRHCLLRIIEGAVQVEDLDSVNGTFINGRRVSGRQIIRPGDNLQVGPVSFIVEYEITQDVLDRLDGGSGVDVLPVVDDAAESDALTVMEVAEDEADVLPVVEEDEAPLAAPADDDDEPIPVLDELDNDPNWHVPPSEDLRDLLADLDDKGPRQRKKKPS